ncbi:MAG: CtsR family transcriptional regulator [Clostridia bacterium]|nr:CtsR family transcriptional regulator [Clostridia bacterium]
MANISDVIEAFILDNMGEDNEIDISRNELASFFSCAPSQINYVLQTRFTLDRGFIKESRRGGGGYIRISKVSFDNDESVASAVLSSIGEEITENRASQIIERLFDAEIISLKERGIIEAMLSREALKVPFAIKDKLRAQSLKACVLHLLGRKEEADE